MLPEMYSLAKASTHVLEDSAFDLEADLREQMSLAFAVKEGAEWITGDGLNEFEGILTNADIGETSSGDNALIKPDTLMDLLTSLGTIYYMRAGWIFNLATLGKVMQLKDANNQYVWLPQMQIQAGAPGTLLGKPYTLVQDMPDVAQNAYPIMVGDFKSMYKLGDRRTVTIQRLIELYAGTGQIGFLATKRTGGQVVLAEAVKKYKISA